MAETMTALSHAFYEWNVTAPWPLFVLFWIIVLIIMLDALIVLWALTPHVYREIVRPYFTRSDP